MPILHRLLFNKLKAVTGGKMNFLLTGSAPLSAETQVRTPHVIHVIIHNTSSTSTYLHVQEFLRTCLEVDMVQGFTMTEATCCGTLQPVGCKQVQI